MYVCRIVIINSTFYCKRLHTFVMTSYTITLKEWSLRSLSLAVRSMLQFNRLPARYKLLLQAHPNAIQTARAGFTRSTLLALYRMSERRTDVLDGCRRFWGFLFAHPSCIHRAVKTTFPSAFHRIYNARQKYSHDVESIFNVAADVVS